MNNENTNQHGALSRANGAREWATTDEIAARYKTCPKTVRHWRRLRRIPFVKIGRLVRFDIGKCDAALDALETTIPTAHKATR